MNYPAYPEYKDSNEGFLGKVPSTWSISPLKHNCAILPSNVDKHIDPAETAVRLCNYTDVYYQDRIVESLELMKASASRDQIEKFTLQAQDVVITKDSESADDIAIPSFVPKRLPNVVCGYHLAIIRPSRAVDGLFLNYLLMAKPLRAYFEIAARGLTRVGLSQFALGRTEVAWPPKEEQTKIARFLDHQTARIDALIVEQQRLIELLKEKRQAVISHAVTKGLDPDVAMKDSGVEWLGEVPVHWEIKKVKYLTLKLEQGWSPQCENSPVQDSSEAGVLKVGCVNNGRFRREENKRLPSELSLDPELTVKAGDLLVSRANTRDLVGSAATPTVDYPNLMISDKLFRLTLDQNSAIPFFLASFLNTPFARRKIEPEATGTSSSMLNIGQSTIREMHVPCPPIGEQISIRDEVVNRTWELMALTERALGLVDLLHERRSALISAAVTGKIDVRDWQPQCSESVSDAFFGEGATV